MMLDIPKGKVEDVLARATCGNTAVAVGDLRFGRWRGEVERRNGIVQIDHRGRMTTILVSAEALYFILSKSIVQGPST